jgi:hypothetical protein
MNVGSIKAGPSDNFANCLYGAETEFILLGNRFQRSVSVCQRQGTASFEALSVSEGLCCLELASRIAYVTAGMFNY